TGIAKASKMGVMDGAFAPNILRPPGFAPKPSISKLKRTLPMSQKLHMAAALAARRMGPLSSIIHLEGKGRKGPPAASKDINRKDRIFTLARKEDVKSYLDTSLQLERVVVDENKPDALIVSPPADSTFLEGSEEDTAVEEIKLSHIPKRAIPLIEVSSLELEEIEVASLELEVERTIKNHTKNPELSIESPRDEGRFGDAEEDRTMGAFVHPELSAKSRPATEGIEAIKSVEIEQDLDEVAVLAPPADTTASEIGEDTKSVETEQMARTVSAKASGNSGEGTLSEDEATAMVRKSELASSDVLTEDKLIVTNTQMNEEGAAKIQRVHVKAAKKVDPQAWKVPRSLLHFSNPIMKNQRRRPGQYSIRVLDAPSGHERPAISLVKEKMGEIGKCLYDSNYAASPYKQQIRDGSIVIGFNRWIDYKIALALEHVSYEGRLLKMRCSENTDSVPGLWEAPIVDEIWYKNMKNQDRCFVVWSQKLKYREVQAMIKEVTGSALPFRRPVPLGGLQTGYLLKASSVTEVGKIILKLDGVIAPIAGEVIGIRPLINRQKYQTEIRMQAREKKRATIESKRT
ncbi:MAG: hypothetical protein SGILL_001406, partial [Bacillariaceae sp.]